MSKTYNLTDETFYKSLDAEKYKRFTCIKEAVEGGFVPCVKITRVGFENSWYNKHINKAYEIHKFIINKPNGYVNFIVKSKDDGSKTGYKPQFSSSSFGKSYDIVHEGACEIFIAMDRQ